MRRARIAVALAVLTVSVAGCADRPNDLDTYYEETPATDQPATPSPAPRDSATPDSDATGLAEAVRTAALTDEDVAGEGVGPGSGLPAASDGCLARIPLAMVGSARVERSWEYPTGSTLHQLVTGYPDRPAAEVLRSRAQCAGDDLHLPDVAEADGVEAYGAWCAGGTCTVLLAGDALLSGVQVDAGDGTRAAAAIRRLAPIAAAKLSLPGQP